MAQPSTQPMPPGAATNDEARSIVQTRVFDAPRELVYEAFTSPEHIGHWWGPNGFTTTTHEMNVQPGGVWRFIMHGPDGTDWPNEIIYDAVIPPERLVYRHGDGKSTHFHVTITFEELGAQTRLTMSSLFPTIESRNYVVEKFGAIEGGRQTLARLCDYLLKQQKELASQ